MLIICIYVYQSFSTMLDKSLRKSIKRRGGGDIGKHKLNEMGALNMKYKKWNKLHISKRSSCGPIKHDCSLKTSVTLEEKKAILGHL